MNNRIRQSPKGSELIIHNSAGLFIQNVQDHLEKSEAENGLLLGLLGLLEKEPPVNPPFMAEYRSGGQFKCAAFFNDRRGLIVSRGEAKTWSLISRTLLDFGKRIVGVVGPSEDSEAMAKAWASLSGCGVDLSMNQRIYRLTEIQWPQGVPGHARLITDDDTETLATWIYEFYREAVPWDLQSKEEIVANVQVRIASKMTYLWESEGQPVAMAALSRPTRHGITINLVYSPTKFRGRGYASALTAAVSAEGLKLGKEFCMLYTDLMNPTSNSIYQKIGYKPVSDSKSYRFRY